MIKVSKTSKTGEKRYYYLFRNDIQILEKEVAPDDMPLPKGNMSPTQWKASVDTDLVVIGNKAVPGYTVKLKKGQTIPNSFVIGLDPKGIYQIAIRQTKTNSISTAWISKYRIDLVK